MQSQRIPHRRRTLVAAALLTIAPALAGGTTARAQDGPPPRGPGGRPPAGPRGEFGRPGPGRDQGPERGEGPSPVIAALDLDRDGRVSADEIAAAATSLKALDANGDGALTPDEMRPRPQGPGGRGQGRPDGPPPERPDGPPPERPDGPPPARFGRGGPDGPPDGPPPARFGRGGPEGRGRPAGGPDADPAPPPPPPPPPRYQLGEVLPPDAREALDLDDSQHEKLEALQATVAKELRAILTPEQREAVERAMRRGPDGPPQNPDGPPPEGPGRGRRPQGPRPPAPPPGR